VELLDIFCNGVTIEPVLQDITREQLGMGSNIAMDVRIDIHALGFWEPQRAAFFEVRVFHPNADCYRDKQLDQIYRNHAGELENTFVFAKNTRHRTKNFYTLSVLIYWWDGQGMFAFP